MSYQITLTDDEYAALAAAATLRGQAVETLVHEALAERYAVSAQGAEKHIDPLLTYMLRIGHIREIPVREAETSAERDARERLAESTAPGMLASEMVIEDRGPR